MFNTIKKNIMPLLILIAFVVSTPCNAMELIKEALTGPEAKICGATTLTFLGGKIAHNLITAQISPQYYSNSKYIVPLQRIYHCIKRNPGCSIFPIITIGLASRASKLLPKLTSAQLKPFIVYSLGSIGLMSLYAGVERYMKSDFFNKENERLQQEIDMEHKYNFELDDEKIEKLKKEKENLNETTCRKQDAIKASTSNFLDFYTLTGFITPLFILYKRYQAH